MTELPSHPSPLQRKQSKCTVVCNVTCLYPHVYKVGCNFQCRSSATDQLQYAYENTTVHSKHFVPEKFCESLANWRDRISSNIILQMNSSSSLHNIKMPQTLNTIN